MHMFDEYKKKNLLNICIIWQYKYTYIRIWIMLFMQYKIEKNSTYRGIV